MLKLRTRVKPARQEDIELSREAPLALSGRSIETSRSADIHPIPTSPFLSLREAADWLCISMSTLKRMITTGELTAVRVGKRRKIPASVLTAYITKDVLFPTQVIDNTGSP